MKPGRLQLIGQALTALLRLPESVLLTASVFVYVLYLSLFTIVFLAAT